MLAAAAAQTETEEVEPPPPKEEVKVEPPYGTTKWIQYWSDFEGHLPSPIDVSITGSIKYPCPELIWYNFDVFPHKIKMTNTGFTVVVGAKWKTQRPYLEGGPFLETHVLSEIHFHWGSNMMDGSDHSVDKLKHPAEMQVTFFRSEYMTQEEALRHNDGVAVVCYMIRAGVSPDERLQKFLDGFPRIQEAKTNTRIGPYPMCQLLPMFSEDYFLYWGSLKTVRGESYVVRWIVPRVALYASFKQVQEFQTLWDPFDEPNIGNCRPLQEREDRHLFFISPHWSQYNSLLPIPRVPEPSISILSPEYMAKLWMLPPQNAYMIPETETDETEEEPKEEEDDMNI